MALYTNYFYLGNPLLPDDQSDSDFYLPPAAYEEIEGVTAATRIGRFQVDVGIGGTELSGDFFGLDRESFSNVGVLAA